MNFNDYQYKAVETLGPDRNPLLLALGVGGEAGEVVEDVLKINSHALKMITHTSQVQEIIKKGHRPGREVDILHLEEEIGDVLWYLAVLGDYYGLDLTTIAEKNIEKLHKRYGEPKAS